MKTNTLTLDLIRSILISEMELDENRIWIYNQKFKVPRSTGLFVFIEYKGPPQTLSSRNGLTSVEQGANEEQDVNMLEEISIQLYSKDLDALQRKEEVLMALHSIYSQQIQEANSFKIFRGAKIIPINELEGTARLYRFDIEVRVQSWYSKVKNQEFYDSHEVEVRVNPEPTFDLTFVIPDTDPTKYPQT